MTAGCANNAHPTGVPTDPPSRWTVVSNDEGAGPLRAGAFALCQRVKLRVNG